MSAPALAKVTVLLAALVLLLVVIVQVSGLCPRASRKLLRWAARRCFAAGPLRERFEEEWLAGLDEVPGELAKLAHTLGVLLFTAVPLWARARWGRSELARWLDRATTPPASGPAGINGAGGAVLARAAAVTLALAVTGLAAVLAVQSTARFLRTPAAPSAASASGSGPSEAQWQRAAGSNASGQAATVDYQQMSWGLQLDTRVVGIPVGATCQLYIFSKDGKRYLGGTWTTDDAENSVWYPGGAAITEAQVRSFEIVTSGLTSPVFITPR